MNDPILALTMLLGLVALSMGVLSINKDLAEYHTLKNQINYHDHYGLTHRNHD